MYCFDYLRTNKVRRSCKLDKQELNIKWGIRRQTRCCDGFKQNSRLRLIYMQSKLRASFQGIWKLAISDSPRSKHITLDFIHWFIQQYSKLTSRAFHFEICLTCVIEDAVWFFRQTNQIIICWLSTLCISICAGYFL